MNIDDAIQSAFACHQNGRLRQAANICLDILAVQSDNIEALQLLGIMCYELGDHNYALTCLKESFDFRPSYALEDHDLAIKCVNEYLIDNPNNTDAYYVLGTILLDKKRIDEAIICYKKILQFPSRYPIDLSDVTFNIPVRIDNEYRMQNFSRLCQVFSANSPQGFILNGSQDSCYAATL